MASDETPSLRILELEKKNAAADDSGPVEETKEMPMAAATSVFNVPSAYRLRANNAETISRDNCNTQLGSHDLFDAGANKNSDGAIPFIDSDDGQTFSSLAGDIRSSEIPTDHRDDMERDVVCKHNLSQNLASDAFTNFTNACRVSGAVSADIHDSASQHDSAFGDIEYPVQQNLRQHVPPPTTFCPGFLDNSGIIGSIDHNLLQHSDDFNRGCTRDGGQDYSPREINESDENNDADKRNTDQSLARSKATRRKQREDKSVIRSEDVAGYYGDKPLADVMAFINGATASEELPVEPNGKRTKKKSGGSSGQPRSMQKNRRKVSNPNDLGDESGSPTPPSSTEENSPTENMSSVTCADSKRADQATENSDQGVEVDDDAALALRLQMEEFALRRDLAPSDKSSVSDEKEQFVTVAGRKPKPSRNSGTRVITTSKGKRKRATTPPPSATLKDERQRRNSYDYSFVGSMANAITTYISAKEISPSSVSTSCRIKAGDVSEAATFFSQVVDNADSDFDKVSFSSADGENVVVKMSYANVASTVVVNRSSVEAAKAKENRSKPLQKDATSPPTESRTKQLLSIPKKSDALTVDVGNPSEFPFLTTAAESTGKYATAGTVRDPKAAAAVSLPPATMALGKSVEDMEFVFVLTEEHESKDAAAPKEESAAENQTAQCGSSPRVVGSGKEALQMLFDSCKDGDPSAEPQEAASSLLAVGGYEEDSMPAVQFLGIPAPTGYNFSFLVGESEDDVVINAVMARSLSIGARPSKAGSMNTSVVSTKSESDASRPGNGGVVAPSAADNHGSQEKVYADMATFAAQAWAAFTGDGETITVYDSGQK